MNMIDSNLFSCGRLILCAKAGREICIITGNKEKKSSWVNTERLKTKRNLVKLKVIKSLKIKFTKAYGREVMVLEE